MGCYRTRLRCLDVEAKDTQRQNFRMACIYVDARTVTMTSSRCLRRPGLGRDPQVLHAVGKFFCRFAFFFFPPKKEKQEQTESTESEGGLSV